MKIYHLEDVPEIDRTIITHIMEEFLHQHRSMQWDDWRSVADDICQTAEGKNYCITQSIALYRREEY